MQRVRGFLIGSLVLVWQLGCGGGSPPLGPPTQNPQANISISPANALVGSGDLVLTVTAKQTFSFVDTVHKRSEVVWAINGANTDLTTTFVSNSELTTIVPASLLANPVRAMLHVENWDNQGDAPLAVSSAVPFSVTSSVPSPSVSSIAPSAVGSGSPDVTITIDGSNFGHFGHFVWSTVFWTTNGNLHDTGTWLQTAIISDTQMKTVIPAGLLQKPTSVQIVVMNGDVMSMSDGNFGYPRSNSVTFTVTP